MYKTSRRSDHARFSGCERPPSGQIIAQFLELSFFLHNHGYVHDNTLALDFITPGIYCLFLGMYFSRFSGCIGPPIGQIIAQF